MRAISDARIAGRLLLAAMLLAALGGVALYFIDHFRPLDLDRPPDFLTKWQLQVLAREPDRCFAALDRGGVEFRRAPARRENDCGYDQAAILQGSRVSYGGPVTLQCPALAALILWERHTLAPAARKHFGRSPASVRQLGTYACRNINREEGRRLSQHAFANAIDIAGIRIEGGPDLSLRGNWNDEDTAAAFLRDVRDGACRLFGVVLSPDYNAAHADHFHFDMSLAGVCR